MPLSHRIKALFGFDPASGQGMKAGLSSVSRSGEGSFEVTQRNSRALEQFFAYIRDETGLKILDLSGLNQHNASFITNLGHKLYSEDFLRNLTTLQAGVDSPESLHPTEIDTFLRQNLDYPDNFFDGVLLWDVLTYLESRLLNATVDRLSHIVKPGSYLLAMFHAPEKTEQVPAYSYRIHNSSSLTLAGRGVQRPVQVFNNRNLEKMFQEFESIKFFLTRDNLREVIVRR